jgi:hypothetical protein
MRRILLVCAATVGLARISAGEDFPKPYDRHCTQREDVFAFAKKPAVRPAGKDRYEITFAVKGYCDVTVGVVDEKGMVVRHLASGVLGKNAPAPFQKDSLTQKIFWNGKDDLDAYPKEPGKLRVRVILGLKPVFDKRLGGASPHALPGGVWGIALDASGAYVFAGASGSFTHKTLRKFDLDGNYVKTLFPPPADMPAEKLAGSSFVEYEPGTRAWHGGDLGDAVSGTCGALPGIDGGLGANECQVALAGTRLVVIEKGGRGGSTMHWLAIDGSTDTKGLKGVPIFSGDTYSSLNPRLAASPDGKWIYITRVAKGFSGFMPAVARGPADGSACAARFIGGGAPGSDNKHLNAPAGIDCDAQGRIYVSDSMNRRIQIFSPEGTYLKTIPVERPGLLRVHQKTGAIYVQHRKRVRGASVPHLTKFVSFDDPTEEFHVDGLTSGSMTIDSWSARPRLWLWGEVKTRKGALVTSHHGLRIHEENGKKFTVLFDFEEEARKEAAKDYMGRWSGRCFDKVVCDPIREHLYYRNRIVFDLRTGRKLGTFSSALKCTFDDAAFDKRGFMHLHFNPCFFTAGVGRVDASNASNNRFTYPEVPYDYGIPKRDWVGVLPTKGQRGPKGFQDGLGVNMKGDVAVESNIYYVPKMEDAGWNLASQGIAARRRTGQYVDSGVMSYASFIGQIRLKQKRGEEVYFIRRRPGIPLAGGTVWTYERSGELLRKCAVIAGDLINGVQIDEDRSVYFVNARIKMSRGKPFLHGRGGTYGAEERTQPFTGTVIKTAPGRECSIILPNAAVPLEPLPSRPPELLATDWPGKGGAGCWIEGAEWLYAGASPITSVGCSCPRQHLGLDWYKRVFVPEVYRHSIGILDTSGNLVMHLGRYGNFDDAPGSINGAKRGGEDIGIMAVRFVSATDNYLAFGDWGERLVVLKLDCHAEETVPIAGR